MKAIAITLLLFTQAAWAVTSLSLECEGEMDHFRAEPSSKSDHEHREHVNYRYTLYLRSPEEQRSMTAYVDSVGTKSKYGRYYDFDLKHWFAVVKADDNEYVLEDTKNYEYVGPLSSGLMSSSNIINRVSGAWSIYSVTVDDETRKVIAKITVTGSCKKIPFFAPPEPMV